MTEEEKLKQLHQLVVPLNLPPFQVAAILGLGSITTEQWIKTNGNLPLTLTNDLSTCIELIEALINLNLDKSIFTWLSNKQPELGLPSALISTTAGQKKVIAFLNK